MEINADPSNPNSFHSTLRERVVEHVFVGDALRRLWQRRITEVEVLRSEFDAGGYDLVMSLRKVVRHIQLKTTIVGGKAAHVSVSQKLAEKPSGCVIWIMVTPELNLQSYLWFGGRPGKAIPEFSHMRMTKHSKGNALGVKTERPNHRTIPRSKFEKIDSLDTVLERLFGPLAKAALVS